MEKLLVRVSLFSALVLLQLGCSSDNDENNNPNPTPARSVKYEVTGNYTGHLTIIYNDNVSGNTVTTVTSLPWSKSIDYPNSVTGIGIGGNTIISNPGVTGQTATLKIYSAGSVVRTSSVSADTNGLINFTTLAYIF